ncbi:MAG: hypothetical protein QM758_16415 [Armatimonas sp.]
MKANPWLGATLILAASAAYAADSLTIYNQNFAVIRQSAQLDLKAGENTLSVTDVARTLEPDSVVLRDPSAKKPFQLLEQGFRTDAMAMQTLLTRYEGKELDFLVSVPGGEQKKVRGKLIRADSGISGGDSFGGGFGSGGFSAGFGGSAIVEIDGTIRFGLPGLPLFSSLGDDTILKPTLSLTISAEKPGPLNAELAYVAGQMNWKASYNVVSPEKSDNLDITALITMTNFCGKSFKDTRVQLVAGDVKKIQPNQFGGFGGGAFGGGMGGMAGGQPAVTEKSFDEYHLYNIERPLTFRHGETKQVEFLRALNISARRLYVYDGAANYQSSVYENDPTANNNGYGQRGNPKVWVMREFENTKANGMGIPLPAGRMRFFRRDGELLQFVGENELKHTPAGERVRLYTGDAFDLIGERKQTNFKTEGGNQIWESFEIKLRNHKTEDVTIRLVERLYRYSNWELTEKSQPLVKTDSRTVEADIKVPAGGEQTITYTVHYWW